MILILIAIWGGLGSGKTLLTTYIAKHIKKPVYANYEIKTPNYHNLEVSNILNLKGSVAVIIDEAYSWIDSRTSQQSSNKVWSYILFQSRHREIDIYLTAQLLQTIDIRYRKMIDVYIYCEQKKGAFYYTIYNKKMVRTGRFKLSFKHAEKYFNLYDTLELIITEEMENLMYDSLSRIEKKKLISKIIQEYRNDPNYKNRRPTHPVVQWFLFDKGYPQKVEKWVYIGLNANIKEKKLILDV